MTQPRCAPATSTATGFARYDRIISERTALPAWRGTGHDRHYEADLDLLGSILTIPVSEGASTQSGLLGKGLDAWFAHEFRRAGFDPDRIWPRAQEPRVLPSDVAALLAALPKTIAVDLRARLTRMPRVAPQDATILGRAYVKQVDVVMSSWRTGPEILLSPKSQSSSYGNNLSNRFEETYGDAGNLRARYPLAAVGFAFVVSTSIADTPAQLAKAIDMMRKQAARPRRRQRLHRHNAPRLRATRRGNDRRAGSDSGRSRCQPLHGDHP
ncbi:MULTISPECIES: hypothetical protein [Actinomyces]|uniref:Uncharacterized protein n=1 Tax=Actinomyces respiraculi TaxID=2744574 RepID=A0A7T0LMJ3_9ACTO|nr:MULTISPECIES: hypothetical protein [Actinomyces]QPL05868.1 hypothetical protein ID810_02585 [Actinomyces respiraculi]